MPLNYLRSRSDAIARNRRVLATVSRSPRVVLHILVGTTSIRSPNVAGPYPISCTPMALGINGPPAGFSLPCGCSATLYDALKFVISSTSPQTAASSAVFYVSRRSGISGFRHHVFTSPNETWGLESCHLFGVLQHQHLDVDRLPPHHSLVEFSSVSPHNLSTSDILQHALFHHYRCRSFVPGFLHPR